MIQLVIQSNSYSTGFHVAIHSIDFRLFALQDMELMLMDCGCEQKPLEVCKLALSSSWAPAPGATQ